MIKLPASKLYDELHSFEARARSGAAYPIHKKLMFDDPSIADIYDWIVCEIGVPEQGSILDAGCGVGYGSIRLAEASQSQVLGISVSAREVEQARLASQDVDIGNRLRFELSSYDELPQGAFELIVAVESLKHSDDLCRSLDSAMRALRPGGRLIVVEDLYSGADDSAIAHQVASNWGLQRLYTEDDYHAIPGCSRVQVVDLSALVNCESLVSRRSKLFGLQLLRMLTAERKRIALSAFIGGLFLQELYVQKLMTYKVLCFEADAGV